jgi:hypothetical protein
MAGQCGVADEHGQLRAVDVAQGDDEPTVRWVGGRVAFGGDQRSVDLVEHLQVRVVQGVAQGLRDVGTGADLQHETGGAARAAPVRDGDQGEREGQQEQGEAARRGRRARPGEVRQDDKTSSARC